MKIRLMYTFMLVILFLTNCSVDRKIALLTEDELIELNDYMKLNKKNKVTISEENEPGQKLWLCLTFVSKETKEAVINQNIHLYHTSTTGDYEPSDPNNESTARLNGQAYTDRNGKLFVQTILPGDYGSSIDNRHIHTTVINASPEAYDIHFKQYTSFFGEKFNANSDQFFLANLKQTKDSVLVTFLTIEVKSPLVNRANSARPDCEWCGASEAPSDISWQTIIADRQEPGEPLILQGTVYYPDKLTPASNIIIYAYHTNDKGLYEKKGDETGNGVRHGYLRGWVKTNSEGKYKFTTIKPAPYPSRTEAAHIHMSLMGEQFDEYYINSTLFRGDLYLNEKDDHGKSINEKYSNVIALTKDTDGKWYGVRDIIIDPKKIN